MSRINISIPQPCHENWEAMTPEDKGRFCASCQKTVHDFTKASDREIVTAFQQNKNLCGRFLNTQLNRDLIKPKEKSSIWLATTTALISLVSLNEVEAQEKAPTEQTDQRVLGKFIATPVKKEIEITGIVSDDIGPLPGALIEIKGKKNSTQSDIDGRFSILAEKGDIILVHFLGMTTQRFTISESLRTINVSMKENTSIMLGMVIQPRKRSFFGRLFHKSKYRYD